MSEVRTVPVDEARRLAELGLLTAGLIHELRQPLFALKAFTELLEQSPERVKDYAPLLHDQIRTLEVLLEGYGDFSRRPVRADEVFDVAVPIRSALVILERRARQAGVQLSLDFGVVPAVRGSMLAMQQAVVNLGQNAIDAVRGQEGGCVSFRTVPDGSGARVEITDNGPGISEEIRDHLFEPFWTTKTAGTGLGLRISRDLLVGAGATLALGEGAGTCWHILVPGV